MQQVAVAPATAPLAAPFPPLHAIRWAWVWRSIHVFVVVKHIVSALYLFTQLAIIYKMDSSEKRATRVIAIPSTIGAYLVLATLHLTFLLRLCLPQRRRQRVSSDNLLQAHTPTKSSPWLHTFTTRLKAWLSSDGFMVFYNVIELACQSYEALAISHRLVRHDAVATYVVFVALHAIVTPLCFLTSHKTTKIILVNWTSSVCSLVMSSVIHIVAFLFPMARYVIFDPNLARNPIFLIRGVTYARYNMVTSISDWVVKCLIHLGSIVSLWRLVKSLEIATNALQRGRRLTIQPSHATSPFQPRPWVKAYVVCSASWGVVLLASLVHSVWFREPCPDACVLSTRPLWATRCQCSYVHVNCATLGLADAETALDGTQLGSNVLAILITRCDLPAGIPNATLHQFPSLYYLGVKFTNTASWPAASLPPQTSVVSLRNMPMATVPTLLLNDVPPALVSMTLSNLPLAEPFVLPTTWRALTRLCLTNISVTSLPSSVLLKMSLNRLFLYQNAITALPDGLHDMSSLTVVDVSGNAMTQAPWGLLNQKGRTLLVCDNPLDDPSVPAAIDAGLRQSFLDMAAVSCASPCAPGCYRHLVGDHECHLPCFNTACGYDNGDCDDMEFDRK